MLFMSENYDKENVAGGPWKLGQSMEIAEDDAKQEHKAFLDRHKLSLNNQKSIKDHVLTQPKAIRERLARELKTGPIELAPPPTPTSATAPAPVDTQREQERRKEQEAISKAATHRTQAVARAAAAVQARAIAEGVAKIKPLTITAAESQGVRVAPLLPGQVPSFVIESTTPLAPIDASAAVAAPVVSVDGMGAATESESAVKVEADPSAPKTSSSLEKAVSPVPGPTRNAAGGLRVPPSPMVVPQLPDSVVAPPLHPTLQVLAPNPLSVTYAASLRPLPPDPTRRITGAGISGGAIHHRSARKTSTLSTHNGNSYSSIAAAKIGPAGSGQADLYRWYVRARASPGAGMVGKADKCLMTSDWKVAFNEQRFVRAMARIEKLKAQGEWSFRQPKKQKGPVVRKAHWDHLLEEMKWLQTDFREERRWKMTVAFHLAHAVQAWHRARTEDERAAMCVSVGPHRSSWTEDAATHAGVEDVIASSSPVEGASDPVIDDEEMPEASASAQVDLSAAEQKFGDAGVTMDVDDDADEAVTKAVDEVIESTRVEEADADGEDDDADADADDVEAATAALVSGEPSKPPQVEVVREALPQSERMPALTTDAPQAAASSTTSDLTSKDAQPAADSKLAQALRNAPKDADSTLTAELPQQLLATLRAPIFSTNVTTTVVSPAALLESLDPEAAAALLGIDVGDLSNAAELLEPGSLSFSKMFPELPMYGGVSAPDPNSKSDRRWDEGSLNQPPRLTHVTKLLDSRPLLVSTLEPSKNRANGRWLPDSDWVVAAEQSDPSRGVADGDAGLPSLPGSLLFARKSNRAAKETAAQASATPAEPSQPDLRAALFLWTPDEDNYLMTLAKQYNNNWPLVADLFNSTRLNTATDKREPWDCYDRVKRITVAAEEGKPPPPPPTLPTPAPAADDSVSSKKDKQLKKLSSSSASKDGSKRKLRRSNLMEVMRKSAKRREASKQAQATQQTKKVNLTSHETHAQIKAGPAVTPQSLSALKTERDQAAIRQYYEQQRIALAHQQQAQQQARVLAQQQQAQQRVAGQNGGVATSAAGPQAGKPAAAATPVPAGSAPAAAQSKAAVVPQPQAPAPPAAPVPTQPAQPAQQAQQAQLQAAAQAAQLQSLQASQAQAQAAQMQSLYAQIQRQQQAQSTAVRPAVGPLTPQQLATLTPAQQQQYHAQLAAAAQQQQLRNQMATLAAQQQFQNQVRPGNAQQQAQQAAVLQMYQQQQAQQQRQAQAAAQQQQMRPPANQAGQVRPGVSPSPRPTPAKTPARPPTPTNANNGSGNTSGNVSPGMPATIQALQQQLAISLATSNLSPEQINGLAIQLYKQAQQQQQAGTGGQAGNVGAGVRPGARPSQQILNQAIQALAAQNQKSQAQQVAQQGAASTARPPTPRPS